jgi:uncharacterized membrane protein
MTDTIPPQNDPFCESVWTHKGYQLDPGNFTTAMVHFYRAEVTRTNLWRSRLDTTTNWAVVTTGAALTFTFSSPQNPHFVLLVVLLLMLTFLNMEARRYTYYALWHHRVRLVETDFFAAMVAPPFRPSADWETALSQTLISPVFPISRLRALAIRYRRNYIWLVTMLIFSWLLKLMIHPTPIQTTSQIVERAAIGPLIPGPWVVGMVGLIYVMLSVTSLVVYRRSPWQIAQPQRTPEANLRLFQAPQPHTRLSIVITNHREKVAERVMEELAHGVTALKGTGMYTGERRDVLLCATRDDQVSKLQKIVEEIDSSAFVVVTQATEVHGFGFSRMPPPS